MDREIIERPKSLLTNSVNSALAGTFAGAMGIFVGHPFDTLKTRIQIGQKLGKDEVGMKLFRTLYRGVVPPLCTAGIMQSINFSLYETARKLIYTPLERYYQVDKIDAYNHPDLHLGAVFLAACCSGSVVSILANPISLIKVQQQVATRVGVIECAKTLYRQYGFSRFYRGYCAMYIMESYGRGVYLWTYEKAKMEYPAMFDRIRVLVRSEVVAHNSTSSSRSTDPVSSSSVQASFVPYNDSSLPVRMAAAATAGCVSWLAIYPCDVVKSRMQMDISGSRYSSCWDCFIKTWNEGGVRLMFRGVKYTLIRAAPVAATILPIYEMTKDWLDKRTSVLLST